MLNMDKFVSGVVWRWRLPKIACPSKKGLPKIARFFAFVLYSTKGFRNNIVRVYIECQRTHKTKFISKRIQTATKSLSGK